jgi:hypothetical protein
MVWSFGFVRRSGESLLPRLSSPREIQRQERMACRKWNYTTIEEQEKGFARQKWYKHGGMPYPIAVV